mgnify:CR=1 FL=1
MATNFYFQSGDTSGTSSEQNLVEDLIIESLKIYGHDVYYMPRTLVNRDTLFDEDSLSQFTQAYPLEMYMENVQGYEGEGDLFSRFGLEVRDQATFILARRRWDSMVDNTGGTFLQEGDRPVEGDFLYFPKTRSIFEVKFVEFQNPFYQLGKIYTFRLECQLVEYSSEELDTGITEIDQIQTDASIDIKDFQFQLEKGDIFLLESSGALIKEDFKTKIATPGDNEDFESEEEALDILDFSESNPFGEL